MKDFIKEIVAIVIALAIWDGGVLFYNWWKKHLAESVKCDICGKPNKTRLTRDKQVWACRKCRKIYNEENDNTR